MATSIATFTTINGIMVHEDRSGVEASYTPDPLGNLIECRNSSGTKTYSAEYWPYGEVQSSTGINPSPWGFVGLLGYLVDAATMLYVRARYLVTKFARWLTVDPLWPTELPYQYVFDSPMQFTDSLGLSINFGGDCDYCEPDCDKKKQCCKDNVTLPGLLGSLCGVVGTGTLVGCLAICIVNSVWTMGLACALCLGILVANIACIIAAYLLNQKGQHKCECAYGLCTMGAVPPTCEDLVTPGEPIYFL